MAESKVLLAAAPALGMRVNGPWMFGNYRGHPVAVREFGPMQNYQMAYQLVLRADAVPLVSQAATDKERVKGLGLKPGQLQVRADAKEIVYVNQPGFRTKAEDVGPTLEGMATLAAVGGLPVGDACEQCGQPSRGVAVVNGLPLQMCEMHFENVRGQVSQYKASETAASVNYPRGIAFGLVGLLIGALLWAAIGIASGYIFSLAAFGIAGLIAFLLAKGAGKVTWPAIGIMALLTILAIFLGDVLWVAVVITQLGGPFDLGLALSAYGATLSEDRSLMASYAFGIFGIFGAAWYMFGAKRAAKDRFEVVA